MEEIMKRLKVMTIFGTRPEAIKMAPIIKEIENRDGMDLVIVVTGQHREMLDQVLELFTINPDYDLDIMDKRQSLTEITVRIMNKLDPILSKERPDLVLVHGDTSTTLVGALVSFYHQIRLGHIEAGLRSYDKYAPYPEEMNRQLVSVLADIHFAPTEKAKDNLVEDNISKDKIYVTGNTVIDALFEVREDNYQFKHPVLKRIDFEKRKIILLTVHRRENLGQPLSRICLAVEKLVDQNNDIEVILPLHLNPVIRKSIYNILAKKERVHLINPLEYQEFVNLMNSVYLILTDSGGIQEEAPALAKPVLVLRDKTERKEALIAGTIRLVGSEKERICKTVNRLINDEEEYKMLASAINPYGDGMASRRIVDIIYRCVK